MQPFITPYNRHETLYKSYLTSINGVKFTFREIDIIACIMHNRGEKKIAVICGISPTTVSTHVHNIMVKLGCNSKDQIIDFIEKARVSKILREYYSSLLVKSNFEKALSQIAAQVNKEAINCYHSKDVEIKNPALYKIIRTHFKKANINLLEFTDPISIIDLAVIKEESYYQDFFQILSSLLNSEKINKIYAEFTDNCMAINVTYDDNLPVYIESGSFKLKRLRFIVVVAFVFVILFIISYKILNNIHSIADDKKLLESHHSSTLIKDLEEFLSVATDGRFSANNINREKVHQNQSIIKKMEKILEYKNLKEVQEYFDKAEMSSDIVVKYLHTLQALASYYMYNAYDGFKSRDILLHAKAIAEHYINHRNKITIDFNILTGEEILSELIVVEHLPQMYTRIIYSLGRTYYYTNELQKSIKYFELAKYLGLKLNLFEGYLSDVSGLLFVGTKQLEQDIKTDSYDRQKIILRSKQLIASYNILKYDARNYIMDYNPSLKVQSFLIPKEHEYNFLCCECNIINLYNLLITIDNANAIQQYVQSIDEILQSPKTFHGLLQLANNIAPRKKAFLYNGLGNVIFTLVDKNYNDSQLRKSIAKALNITSSNNLELAEKLFDQAKVISREVDYTKADAYDGLIRVYRKKLESVHISSANKKELEQQIEDYVQKRNYINNLLHRQI